MKMADCDQIQVLKPGLRLSKSQETAATGIDQYSGFAIIPYKIGTGSTAIISHRTTRTKDL